MPSTEDRVRERYAHQRRLADRAREACQWAKDNLPHELAGGQLKYMAYKDAVNIAWSKQQPPVREGQELIRTEWIGKVTFSAGDEPGSAWPLAAPSGALEGAEERYQRGIELAEQIASFDSQREQG